VIKYIHYFRVASGHLYREVRHVYTDEDKAMMALRLCGGRVEVVSVIGEVR
jgi:hypothetical protein